MQKWVTKLKFLFYGKKYFVFRLFIEIKKIGYYLKINLFSDDLIQLEFLMEISSLLGAMQKFHNAG